MTTAVFGRLEALADPIRVRLLLALERQELTVRELQAVLQVPQSTASRHLKVLADAGLVELRSEGTSNWYRFLRERDGAGRRLWLAVRDEAARSPAARRDAERLRRVLAERHRASQRFFDSAAGQWDRVRRELFGARMALLAPLGLLDPGWVVGDLGCGTGEVAEVILPFVGRVIGVDESAAMRQAARRRLGDTPALELRAGTLEALPIADGELDAAMLVLVLHHLSDPLRALVEARRTLRPGGRLLVVDMVPHEHVEYRERMGHQWLGFGEAELAAWLAEAGFGGVRRRALPQDPDARGPALFVATARAEAPAPLITGAPLPEGHDIEGSTS
ncbi:MAG TPA: metalloregulator ArsR/SmtB family transcription factor [Gemmatimonadales bacterium]|nr:metalloregulator ArsR/SmtB family transcription factor [Gemmatimonadales bacterium]